MATLAQSYASMVDLLKSKEGEKQATIIELLHQANGVIDDFMAVECNMGASNLHTIRNRLPTGAWGSLYKGIAQSKSGKQQVSDVTGFYEQSCQVDTRLLDLADDPAAFRMQEAMAHLEAMHQEIATGFFYHSTDTAPEKFMGLSPRFSELGTSGTANQIVDAGGTGSDNMSIWFVTHGYNDVCTLYPKNTKAGFNHEDKGEQRVTDDSGNPYYVKEDLWRWHFGVAVKDYRNVARIANIDESNLAAGSVDLYNFMRKAYYKLQTRRTGKINNQTGVGRTVIYANRDALEALDALATNAGTTDNFTRLRPMEIEGKEVMSYRGLPIRETDALINTEARIV